MNVYAVGETLEAVRCYNGLVVQPAYSLETCPQSDILVVPGGYGSLKRVEQPQMARLLDWIVQRSNDAELTTSVCSGSFLLAKAGLLRGKSATTYWSLVQQFREDFPEVGVQEGVRWVDAGKIVTSAGISAGIDMSLHILERLYGSEVAQATAHHMEYDYWK